MRWKIPFLMMAILALVATGCRDWFPPIEPHDPDPDPNTPAGEIRNAKWCLTWFSEDGYVATIDPMRNIHLVFGGGDTVTGFTGCNRLWGSYKTGSNGALSFGSIVTTKVWCDDNGTYEVRFLDALRKATSYRLEPGGGSLRIYYGGSETYMLFNRCDNVGGPGDSTGVDSTGGTHEAGDTIYLRIKTEATIPGANLTLRFAALLEESRCPTGATCVWEGNAKVRVAMMGKGTTTSMELNTHVEPKSAESMGYRVHLLDVLPYPNILADPNPDGYIAVLLVTKI